MDDTELAIWRNAVAYTPPVITPGGAILHRYPGPDTPHRYWLHCSIISDSRRLRLTPHSWVWVVCEGGLSPDNQHYMQPYYRYMEI